MEKYFKVKNSEEEIKVSTGYTLGGMSYLSGQNSARGYYLYVQPVERKIDASGRTVSESFTLFKGFKVLLVSVERKSKKAEAEAENKAEVLAYTYAKEYADRNGLEIEEEAMV